MFMQSEQIQKESLSKQALQKDQNLNFDERRDKNMAVILLKSLTK